MKLQFLRKKYPKFIYERYSYQVLKRDLKISFHFRVQRENKVLAKSGSYSKIEPNIYFKPKITIKNCSRPNLEQLDNLIFHLGLIEMISYWKATCSPKIIIKAGSLNSEQIKWWKDLIINGMGQFFYENKIDWRPRNFLKIYCSRQNLKQYGFFKKNLKKRYLVPVGGGKDSIVTLELLKKTKKDINCFSLNPTKAAQKIMKIAGCKKPIIVRRKIDKKLLALNRKGFLNGHTPFSAYLAFLSVLTAAIFNYKYIAFSNEKSSNEGNLKYLGKTINHQWSKSFEFEKKFRKYSKKFLSKNIKYFSFLRPFYEIQIARMFSKYPKYFPVFLSCNEAYKTASGTKKPFKKWCGKCSKCLFAFVILYPFINEQKLVKIFRKNLFEDKKLVSIMQELMGERKFKPFECVGTKKESRMAFNLSLKKAKKLGKIPYLLTKI